MEERGRGGAWAWVNGRTRASARATVRTPSAKWGRLVLVVCAGGARPPSAPIPPLPNVEGGRGGRENGGAPPHPAHRPHQSPTQLTACVRTVARSLARACSFALAHAPPRPRSPGRRVYRAHRPLTPPPPSTVVQQNPHVDKPTVFRHRLLGFIYLIRSSFENRHC